MPRRNLGLALPVARARADRRRDAVGHRHQATKQEVLHDGQLGEQLGEKHASEAGVDPGPAVAHATDVVEQRAVPA